MYALHILSTLIGLSFLNACKIRSWLNHTNVIALNEANSKEQIQHHLETSWLGLWADVMGGNKPPPPTDTKRLVIEGRQQRLVKPGRQKRLTKQGRQLRLAPLKTSDRRETSEAIETK